MILALWQDNMPQAGDKNKRNYTNVLKASCGSQPLKSPLLSPSRTKPLRNWPMRRIPESALPRLSENWMKPREPAGSHSASGALGCLTLLPAAES